jgi:glycosyltransferase involved in cell wall biosynthesis
MNEGGVSRHRMLMAGYVDAQDPERLGRLTGGILYDFNVSEKFRASGWDVQYFNLESLPRYAKMLKLPSASIISRRAGRSFDVLLTDSGSSSLTLGLQRRAKHLGQFTVLICHHFRSKLESSLLKRLLYTYTEKRIVSEADFIAAISESTVRRLKELGRDEKDILLAPPGLNVRLGDGPRFRDNPGRLLLVGNVEPRKGIIEALKGLASSGVENAELCIAGDRSFDPGYLAKVETCIEELNLNGRVHIPGRLSDEELSREYDRADVFLLPSHWEGYGMAIAEALARGLPVISTTAGAIPDLVTQGESGLLVASGDWRETGTAIRRLLTDPALRKKLAEGAYRSAEQLPSWDSITTLVFEAVTERMRQAGMVRIGSDS